MNEEFSIQLKTVLDQSSITQVKEQLSALGKETSNKYTVAVSPAKNVTEVFDIEGAEEYSAQIDLIMYKINDLKASLELADKDPTLFSTFDIIEMRAELEKLENQLLKLQGKGSSGATSWSKTVVVVKNNLKDSVKHATRFVGALIGARGAYSAIRKAMSTWLSQNDELQSKLNGAWYALGSLFAPVLEWIVNKFVYLVSLVDALAKSLGFAGVNMAKYGKAAGKASKQTAGFDELNNIGSQSGGGSASSFDLEPITDDALKIFKTIATIVAGIAAGIAAWKIAEDIFKLPLKEATGIGLAVAGATIFVLAFVDAWKNGIDWQNLALMLTGVTVAALGMSLWLGPIAGALTLVVGGFALLVLGIREFIKTGELTKPVFLAIFAGCTLIGAGIALLTGSWIPLVVGMIFGILIPAFLENKETFIETWENIKEAIRKGWEKIKEWFSKGVEKVKTSIVNLETKIGNFKETVKTKFEAIKTSISTIWDNVKEKVLGVWDEIKTGLEQKWENLKSWWSGLSLGGFHIKLPHLSWSNDGFMGLPKLNVDWYAKGGMFTNPSIIGVGEYANASSNPEVVAPLSTLSDYMSNDNTRVEELLVRLIDVVDSKEFRTYISRKEIGDAAIDEIHRQSRMKGVSVV